MWKRLKDFICEMESINFSNLSKEEKEIIKGRLLTNISFFQHERIVHLIVTVTFAILTMIGIVFITIHPNILIMFLVILFIILLIPYVIHYYRLENGVQKLYTFYDKL